MLRDSEAGPDGALWMRMVTCVDEADDPRLGERVATRGGAGGREERLKDAVWDRGCEGWRRCTVKEGGGGSGAGRWSMQVVPE